MKFAIHPRLYVLIEGLKLENGIFKEVGSISNIQLTILCILLWLSDITVRTAFESSFDSSV